MGGTWSGGGVQFLSMDEKPTIKLYETKKELVLLFTQSGDDSILSLNQASLKRLETFKKKSGVVYSLCNTRTTNDFDKDVKLTIDNIDGTDKQYVVVCPANVEGPVSFYDAPIYKHALPYNRLKRYIGMHDSVFGPDLKTAINESLYAEDSLFVYYLMEKEYKFTDSITHNHKKYHKPPEAHVLQNIQGLNKEVYDKIVETNFSDINVLCQTELDQTKGSNLTIVFEFVILSFLYL